MIISKAAGLLQLTATSLLMHEDDARAVLDLYRRLRGDSSVEFPKIDVKSSQALAVKGSLVEEALYDEEGGLAEDRGEEALEEATLESLDRRIVLALEPRGRSSVGVGSSSSVGASRSSVVVSSPSSIPAGKGPQESPDLLGDEHGEQDAPAYPPDCMTLRRLRPQLVALIQDKSESDEDDETVLLELMNLLSRLDAAVDADDRRRKAMAGASAAAAPEQRSDSSSPASPASLYPDTRLAQSVFGEASPSDVVPASSHPVFGRASSTGRTDGDASVAPPPSIRVGPDGTRFGTSRASRLVREEESSSSRPGDRRGQRKTRDPDRPIDSFAPPRGHNDERVFQINLMNPCPRCHDGYLDDSKSFCSSCGRIDTALQ